jgi:formylglycine-generating enzyme required for sulfatase activity
MPVGCYPNGASLYGAQDMAGNVLEWTSAVYRPYPYIATDGREQPELTWDHVMRGGSWYGFADSVRAAKRYRVHPTSCGAYEEGFRMALTAPIS